jgi:glutamate racemase
LVGQIEKGDLSGPETRRILEKALHPMLDRGIDTVVLGCTHYPFVIPLIEQIVGANVRVIDPAPAVARQVRRLLELRGFRHPAREKAGVRYYTTAVAESLAALLLPWLGESGKVIAVGWENGKLECRA